MKEFKSIMIRGLDEPENQELVRIMNIDIERYPEINTATAVFDFVLKDWEKTKKELMHQIREYNELEQITTKKINELSDIVESTKEKVTNFKTALKALNTIK